MPVNFQTEMIFMYALLPKIKLARQVWHQPCDIQSFLNFSLYWTQQVSTHLLQQLCQKNEQPVLKVLLMDLDEIHQRLQEHTEDLDAWNAQWFPDIPFKAGMSRPSPWGPQGSGGYLCYHVYNASTWDPTTLGESVFCSGGQKTRLDYWPRELSLDIPDLRHARRIWIYRVLRFKNEEALCEVSIYWHISAGVHLHFKWKNLKPP